jgi:hypothetical protein
MQHRSWAHFSCHGLQPFMSSFYDGDVTLLDLIKAHIFNVDFTFLSAWHTAVGNGVKPLDGIWGLPCSRLVPDYRKDT